MCVAGWFFSNGVSWTFSLEYSSAPQLRLSLGSWLRLQGTILKFWTGSATQLLRPEALWAGELPSGSGP